jgi:hypothetical protein
MLPLDRTTHRGHFPLWTVTGLSYLLHSFKKVAARVRDWRRARGQSLLALNAIKHRPLMFDFPGLGKSHRLWQVSDIDLVSAAVALEIIDSKVDELVGRFPPAQWDARRASHGTGRRRENLFESGG